MTPSANPATGLRNATNQRYGARVARATAWFVVALALTLAAWLIAAVFSGAATSTAAGIGLVTLLVAGLILVTATHRMSAYPPRPR